MTKELIKENIENICRGYLFEMNTEETVNRMKSEIDMFLHMNTDLTIKDFNVEVDSGTGIININWEK